MAATVAANIANIANAAAVTAPAQASVLSCATVAGNSCVFRGGSQLALPKRVLQTVAGRRNSPPNRPLKGNDRDDKDLTFFVCPEHKRGGLRELREANLFE